MVSTATGSTLFYLGRGSDDRLRALGYVDGPHQTTPLDPTHLTEAFEELGQSDPSPLHEGLLRLVNSCRPLPDERPADLYLRLWGTHPFVEVTPEDHVSTFAADADTASFALARRILQSGALPPVEQVRTEEFVNWFRADQPPPPPDQTFAIGLELAPTPFVPSDTELLRVTLRGKDVPRYARPPYALTFVVDTSGSMNDEHRFEHVRGALALLFEELEPTDQVALVTFAEQANVACPPTSAARRGPLEDALWAVLPNGGTNLEAGILEGFRLAAENLVPGAVNRVVLLSDGVGNIGQTKQEAILAEVEGYREKGLYLNTIGVGLRHYHDAFLEQLADRGDGVCNYVGSLADAREVLVDGFTRTLQPIARDVKIQVDFDPASVLRYRQIGYENRALADSDFRDDAVDAGEIHAGYQVAALYEVVRLPGAPSARPLVTVRVRYKPPFAVDRGSTSAQAADDAERAFEIEASLEPYEVAPAFRAASWGLRRDALVAEFAELLRHNRAARDDSLELFRAELQALLDLRPSDLELAELAGLVDTALPLLRERRSAAPPPWRAPLDELRDFEYRAAQRTFHRGPADPATLAEESRRRNELYAALRRALEEPSGTSESDGE